MKAKSNFIRLINEKLFSGSFVEFLDEHPPIYKLIDHILTDYPDFWTHSGAGYEGQHHYGDGGLAQHTYEVLEFCLANSKITNKRVNRTVLILSTLYHDLGKLWDYERNPAHEDDDMDPSPINEPEWIPTKHKRNIHHISKSAMIFYEQANKFGLDEDTREAVLHCILSHHTTRAHGSPVAPKSREAWILTLCDNMSARMYDCDTWDFIDKKK